MELVSIVSALALLEYIYFGVDVGRARGKYNIAAPAVTGHPVFERHHRVHQNTLENLVIFLPGLWMFALFVNEPLAAALGIVFVVGRVIYARLYVAAPETRAPGVFASFGPALLLLLGGLLGALASLF